MKKIIMLLFCLPLTFCFFSYARAVSIEDEANGLYSSLDSDTRDILYQFGIDSAVSDGFFDVSFSSIFNCIVNIFTSCIKKPVIYTLKLLSIIICVSVLRGFAAGFEDVMSLFCTLLCCAVSLDGIRECISLLLSCINGCSAFLAAYVPVFSVIIALSASTTGALSYNTTVLAFSEIIAQCAAKLLMPACGIMLSMGIALGTNSMFNAKRVSGMINRCITWISYTVMSLFSAVLGLKGMLSSGTDGIANRGIKLMLSSFVPVVGSVISEAYSSILGSLALVKGSAAVFGIVAVAAICLPALVQSLLYSFSLSFLSYASEIAGVSTMNGIFGCIKSTLKLMNMAAAVQIFITVISTGIMMLIRSA